MCQFAQFFQDTFCELAAVSFFNEAFEGIESDCFGSQFRFGSQFGRENTKTVPVGSQVVDQ